MPRGDAESGGEAGDGVAVGEEGALAGLQARKEGRAGLHLDPLLPP